MTPKRLTRVEAQAQTRARLLQAAAQVFMQRGFEGASVEEIAAQAGFSKGAVYAHFPNKDALFYEACDQYMRESGETLQEIFKREKSSLGRVEAAGQHYSDVIKKYQEWELLSQEYWLYAQRNPESRERLIQDTRELRREIMTFIEPLYEEQSVSPPLPVEHLALLCIALVKGLSMLQISDPESIPDHLYGDAFRLVLGFQQNATANEDKAT